jgi:glycosyltransferase involved in cell wall biosynthesis
MAIMSQPKVSIVTIAYNSADTIGATLQSVANQDYPNIEHIIIDGLSKDNTVAIAKQYPHIVKIVSEQDYGLYDAMNKGIRHATGDIIGIINSDDFFNSNTVVSEVVAKMEAENTDTLYADLVYVHRVNTKKVLRSWRTGNFKAFKFLFGWMPPHPTFFVRRHIYEKYGTFNTDLKYSADYDLILRFLYKHRVSVSYLPKTIVRMRIGGVSNASLSNRLKANREDREAWRLNELKPYFFTLTLKPLRKVVQWYSRMKL